MTIGMGFLCKDGVVLAADQQHTVEGYYKFHGTKLGNIMSGKCKIFWTYSHLPNLAIALQNLVLPSISVDATSDDVVTVISGHIKNLKKEYRTDMKYQQFLFAISVFGERTRLLRYSGGIIDEPYFACIGVGDSSLVNYMISSFTFVPPPLVDANDALTLAIYTIAYAKKFVDKCGGNTDAVVLGNDGGFIPVIGSSSRTMEETFVPMQDAFKSLYNIVTNARISRPEREKLLVELCNTVRVQWC